MTASAVTIDIGRFSVASDLGRLLPLTGRRRGLLALRLAAVACLVGGVVGVAVAGRTSAWAGLLSLLLPGLGQLVAGRALVGGIVLVLGLACWVYAIMRSGGWSLLLLAPWAALDAASGGAAWAIPVGLAITAASVVAIEQITRRWRDARIARFESVLEHERDLVLAPTVVPAHVAAVDVASAPPLDRFAEAYLQYFLRFGHAPADDWSVFDDPKHVDSELRYQLVLSAWALFHFQHQYTPAYREAASQALTNLAERGRDPRVWGYTVRENLKGLRFDPDPFRRENVMYSGYLANVLSMHRAMTGDDRYDQPGGYAVSDGKRTFDWNHTSIVEQLALQHATSPFGSISCFPGWVFPPCQSFSLRALQLYDVVHGTDHSFAFDRYLEAFEKWFIDEHGHIATCRHVAGFKHPIDPIVVGVTGQAAGGLFTAGFSPAAVERNYTQQVRSRMSAPDADGRIGLRLAKLDTYDTSYGWNPGMPYSFALLYAAEMGDDEATGGLRRSLEDMMTPEEPRPGPGSLLSMAVTMMALTNSRSALAASHRQAPAAATTPELAHAPYPNVAVTRAVVADGGVDADLVPGPDAGGEVELVFHRLRPDTEHTVERDGVVAGSARTDRDGRLVVRHDSRRRGRVAVTPAG